MSTPQFSFFHPVPAVPEGFAYQKDLISPEQERQLLENFAGLDFREFEFHGYRGKRRVVSFGLQYDFAGAKLRRAAELPSFLPGTQGSGGEVWHPQRFLIVPCSRHGISARGGHRLASRSISLWRGHRSFIGIRMPLPLQAQAR